MIIRYRDFITVLAVTIAYYRGCEFRIGVLVY